MSQLPTIKELFAAGAHFGHRKNRTDARARDYVFTYRNRVSVINLEKTLESLKKALDFVEVEAAKGSTILFVGTKLQGKDLIKKYSTSISQPYIVERWPGGLVSNFDVVIKSIRKMVKTEQDIQDNKFEHLKKKEILKIQKDLDKSKKIFGGLSMMEKVPNIILVIDAKHETNAVKEAIGAKIPTIGISDTNSDPTVLTYPIVANDDSHDTIELILKLITETYSKNFKAQAPAQSEVEQRVDAKTKADKQSKPAKPKVSKEK